MEIIQIMQWPLADFLFEACFEYEAEWIVEFTYVIPILLLVCFFFCVKRKWKEEEIF